MVWFQFIISAIVIVLAGIRLTHYADLLSERKNLCKVWVGIFLLGLVTSLPEAVASLTAVIGLKAGDLAVGNMLGSNVFNIFLVVLMDFIYRKSSVTSQLPFNRQRLLPTLFAGVFLCIVALEIFLSNFWRLPQFLNMSLGSLVIIILYFWAIRSLSSQGQGGSNKAEGMPVTAGTQPMSHIYFNLVLSAVFVVGASIWLTTIADEIAVITGLGRTFVGTLFLAFATSLPEMVVTISALKLASLDMALGNIFGSNMINIFILAVCDIFYRPQALLGSVSRTHLMTALVGIVMTAVVWLGIKNKSKRTFFRLGWDSMALIALFVLAMSLAYYFR